MLVNLLQEEGYIFLSINLKVLNKTTTVHLQVEQSFHACNYHSYISNFALRMNALKEWYNCVEEDLKSVLKSKFKSFLVQSAQDKKAW